MRRRAALRAALLLAAAAAAAGWILGSMAGCSVISAPPVARFGVEPTILYSGEPVRFDGAPSLSDSAIIDYSWDLGNGETASGREITATFSQPGVYEVTLRVQNSAGHSDAHSEQVTVYVRGGTQIFFEDFSSGAPSLGRWSLDPTWASEGESRIEIIVGPPGYCLFVTSGADRWHRRYVEVAIPPLRLGQKLVFSCNAMTLQNQDAHTFIIAPGRRDISSAIGSFPYFEFTSNGGGAYVREPSAHGPGIGHVLPFTPQVYRWQNYEFVYSEDGYELFVDGVLQLAGPMSMDLSSGGPFHILLGEESSTESCSVYYDDIRLRVEE